MLVGHSGRASNLNLGLLGLQVCCAPLRVLPALEIILLALTTVLVVLPVALHPVNSILVIPIVPCFTAQTILLVATMPILLVLGISLLPTTEIFVIMRSTHVRPSSFVETTGRAQPSGYALRPQP